MGTVLALLASLVMGDKPTKASDEINSTPVSYVVPAEAEVQPETEPEASTEPEAPGAATDAKTETWTGEIQLPGATLAFTIQIVESDGAWTGSIDIPAQGVEALPLKDIVRTATALSFGAELAGLPEHNWPNWELAIDADEESAEGVLHQSGQEFATTMTLGEPAPLIRPQEPKEPLPYRTSEVAVPTSAGHSLAGTLTLPDAGEFGDGPYPTAVFISGSGPQDRDETLMGHKPFAVIADHLARRGIASLRCDDRGVAGSGGDFSSATSLDFGDDAMAQVEFLEGVEAAGSVGLIGHSEGAMIAPFLAADSDSIDWIVLLAGPGVPGRDVLSRQLKAMAMAEGQTDEASLDAQIVQQQLAFDAALAGDDAGLKAALSEVVVTQLQEAGVEADETLIVQSVAQQERIIKSPWFLTFLNTDASVPLRRVTQPVLVLNGDLDMQILHDQNVPEIVNALEEAGNGDVEVHVLKGLNHLFQPATTGGLSEYGTIETTFDPGALAIISDWIERR